MKKSSLNFRTKKSGAKKALTRSFWETNKSALLLSVITNVEGKLLAKEERAKTARQPLHKASRNSAIKTYRIFAEGLFMISQLVTRVQK